MKPAETNPNDAGTYMVDSKGRRSLVEPVTADHPEGNRARPAEDDPQALDEPHRPGEDSAGKSALARQLEANLKGGA